MPNQGPDDELLAAALAGAPDCPPLHDLERLLHEGVSVPLKQHVDACAYCQAELQMLRSFTSNEVAEHERAAVDTIAQRLRTGSSQIVAARAAAAEKRQPWWRQLFAVPWLTPAAATLAVALVIAGVAVQLRQGRQPSLDTGPGGSEVLRSTAIEILSPVGDLSEKPSELRWQAIPNAAKYRVRLMEVDRAELWRGDTDEPRIDLPASVETFIVPAKTLLIQVAALDAAGAQIAESDIVRFRLLQKVYTQ